MESKKKTLEIHFSDKLSENLLQTWSDINFIGHSTIQQHQYVTDCILELLKYTSKIQVEKLLLGYLITGVQIHMESPNLTKRKFGMKIAESFSKIISPENPLKFDELTEEKEDIKKEDIQFQEAKKDEKKEH